MPRIKSCRADNGEALCCRLCQALQGDKALQFLKAGVDALRAGNPQSLQVGACRCIAALTPKVDPAALKPLLNPIYEGKHHLRLFSQSRIKIRHCPEDHIRDVATDIHPLRLPNENLYSCLIFFANAFKASVRAIPLPCIQSGDCVVCVAGLGRLLQEFSEETMHLLLETLVVVVRGDAQTAAAWEPHLSAAVLQLWAANVTDPLLSVDALDVLQALADNPAALSSLQVGQFLSDLCSMPPLSKADTVTHRLLRLQKILAT